MELKSKWRYLRGHIVVPPEVLERNEPIVLHISDTPRVIFKAIAELIDAIQPEYIVHTGDLVDNLKLELYPALTPTYEKWVDQIVGLVAKAGKKGYIALGNHDLDYVAQATSDTLTVTRGLITTELEGHAVSISHIYHKDAPGELYLFGHDDTSPKHSRELNGIHAIHVIFLESMQVVRLQYPWGTQDQRLIKRKIGL